MANYNDEIISQEKVDYLVENFAQTRGGKGFSEIEVGDFIKRVTEMLTGAMCINMVLDEELDIDYDNENNELVFRLHTSYEDKKELASGDEILREMVEPQLDEDGEEKLFWNFEKDE